MPNDVMDFFDDLDPMDSYYPNEESEESKMVNDKKPATKDIKDVRSALILHMEQQSTYLMLVAVNKNGSHNEQMRIATNHGTPIGGYVIDHVNDQYIINCFDYINLGTVPVSFTMRMDNVGNWGIKVPVPETVLKRYLLEEQKAEIKKFREKYSDNEVEYHFIQMVVQTPNFIIPK
jgi:hypothetical protein